jgi:prepilin signal peptidase PulO-like enzyme (type II secretory pathway)
MVDPSESESTANDHGEPVTDLSSALPLAAGSSHADSPDAISPAAESAPIELAMAEPAPVPRFWYVVGGILGAIAVLFAGLPLALAGYDYQQAPFDPKDDFSQTFAQRLQFRYLEAFVAVWFFSLGASVGSFLNVVVYRWPRNRSVVLRSSHCPRCDSRIRAIDNIPIIGWFRLRAACRNCRLPIASRYPAIELSVGAMFVLFYFVELISGGLNLPVRMPNLYQGMLWTVFYPKWDLISIYAFHMYMLCLVLVWFLMQYDGQRFPIGRLGLCLASMLVLSLILIDVHPQSSQLGAWFSQPLPIWLDHGLLSTLGLVCGAVVGGGIVRWLLRQRTGVQDFAGLMFVGAGLGWRASIWIGGLAAITWLLVGRRPAAQAGEVEPAIGGQRDWVWSAAVWSWAILFLAGWRALWLTVGWV